MVFAVEDSPVYLVGAFTCMAAFLDNLAKVQPAFKTGAAWRRGTRQAVCSVRLQSFFAPAIRTIW